MNITAITKNRSKRMEIFLIIIVGTFAYGIYNALKKQEIIKDKYREEVQSLMRDIVEKKIPVEADDTPPFKMKKDEKYLFGADAVLGTYKSDGRIAGHGVTARIKIAKGLYYRLGSGRVGMGKSWMYDEPGTLHFTTDRIIFNGSTKNYSVPMHKILDISLGEEGKEIYVDREAGADWSFRMPGIIPADKLATAILFQRGAIEAQC